MKPKEFIKRLIEEERSREEASCIPDPEPVPVTVRIDRAGLEAAEALAKRFGKSRHEMLVWLLEGAIDEAVETYNAEMNGGELGELIPEPGDHFMLHVHEEDAA